MARAMFLCVMLLMALWPTFAAQPIRADAPQTLVPMSATPPICGTVTIIATCGQFYTNLGKREQLCNGADMLVVRYGIVIGRARVLKVNEMDSIAVLLPEYTSVMPISGDSVVVQYNQPMTTRRVIVVPVRQSTPNPGARMVSHGANPRPIARPSAVQSASPAPRVVMRTVPARRCCTTRLTDLEPDMRMGEYETLFGVAVLTGLVLGLTN